MIRLTGAALAAATLFAASSVSAQVTTYTDAAAFTAATTGVATTNFEGSSTLPQWILSSGSYSGTGFTLTQSTNNVFLTPPAYTNYYYNWGTGYVLNTPYLGALTITFTTPVTAFGLDLGNFYDAQIPGVCCQASTRYGLPLSISTSQGSFTVDPNTTQNFSFFGATSDTAFTSFTITGFPTAPHSSTGSTIIDNLRIGSAIVAPPAVPEASTWAMMIAGFGMVGGAARARRRKTSVKVNFA